MFNNGCYVDMINPKTGESTKNLQNISIDPSYITTKEFGDYIYIKINMPNPWNADTLKSMGDSFIARANLVISIYSEALINLYEFDLLTYGSDNKLKWTIVNTGINCRPVWYNNISKKYCYSYLAYSRLTTIIDCIFYLKKEDWDESMKEKMACDINIMRIPILIL